MKFQIKIKTVRRNKVKFGKINVEANTETHENETFSNK